MAPFEQLQELWQSQNPARSAASFDARGLAGGLRRYGRQQNYINLVRVALVIFCLWGPILRFHWNPSAICGAVLIFGGMAIYLFLDWRNQIGLSRLDFSLPALQFIREARRRLQHQLNPMRRVFWLILVSVGGGLNLLEVAKPRAPLPQTIARHVLATALPFVAYAFVIKIRRFRFRKECGGILEKLDGLLCEMEEQSQ